MPELLRSADVNQTDMDALKVPPHSLQAEEAVLGGLMLDNSGWDTVLILSRKKISTGVIIA